MIILPVYNLFVNSFTSIGFGQPVGFTLQNYITVFTDPQLGMLFANSFVYALGSALFSVSIASLLAWIVARTDAPLKKLAELLPVIPLVFPPILKNIAWIHILAPRSGILNNLLSDLVGTKVTIFNAFSIPAMIWTYGLAMVPVAFLFILPSFILGDPSLEEAANMSGASTRKAMFKITLPLAFPAIFSTFILMLIGGLEAFETAVLQGMPGGIYVFVSRVYDAIEVKLNPGLATAYASILITITISLVGVYVWSTRKAHKYATVVGKAYRPRLIRLGKWKYVAFLFVLGFFFISTIIPYGVVAVISAIPYFEYSVFKSFPSHLTNTNYVEVLSHPTFQRGMLNSLLLGLSAAVVVVIACAIMAYVIHRGTGRGKKLFEFTGTLPLGFPGILLGLGLLWAYYGTPLFGSLWGILVAYLVVYTPHGLRTLSSATIRIHKELEEASNVHGGSWLYTFRRITLPLLKPAMAAGFFFIFIQAQRNLGSVVLLSGPGIEVAPAVIFDYFNAGQWGETAAAGLIFSSTLLAYLLIAKYSLKIKFTAAE